jgi:hypothetical protein
MHFRRAGSAPSVSAALLLLCAAPAASAGDQAFDPPQPPPMIEAVRVAAAPVVDGRLTERDWVHAPVARGFRQIDPRQGEPASFDTEVRVLYDGTRLYVGAFCRDESGTGAVRVRNLRKDFDSSTDDIFGVAFDTFRDGQNALVFQVNPFGARRDVQVRDGSEEDVDWDAAWQAATTRTAEGWTVEMAIPWSTLRYPPLDGEWSVNFLRVLRRLNETTGWSPWPRAYTPYRMAYAGRLSGLQPPPPSRNLRFQPYAAARRLSGAGQRDQEADVGGDVKWALTSNTVLDVTVNTDFAEADVDRQVINLTRFSVFFPEQRPFFLENASLFTAGLEREVRPFFSRRLGLREDGTPIPIDAGLRLTHRTGDRSAGALLLQQGGRSEDPATVFALGRYVQNLGPESRVGAHLVSRLDEQPEGPRAHNSVGTLDTFLRLGPTVYARGMVSGSHTSGGRGQGLAASLDLAKEGNWGRVSLTEEYIGPRYEAGTGFVSRPDLVRTSPSFTLDARPAWKPGFLRRFVWSAGANVYHRASDGRFQEARVLVPLLGVGFDRGGWLLTHVVPNWQRLERPFSPLPGMNIAPGRYQFTRYAVTTSTTPSRPVGLRVDAEVGPFYDGSSRAVTAYLHASPTPRVAFLGSYGLNVLRDVGSARTDSTTHLVQPALRLSLDPRLHLVGLYQYNSAAQVSAWNARFSWEFRALSYVYLVFNQRRPTAAASTTPAERQLIFKVTLNRPW